MTIFPHPEAEPSSQPPAGSSELIFEHGTKVNPQQHEVTLQTIQFDIFQTIFEGS
jgi:hypothetical protein